jgi:hypothetical protein
VRISDRAEQPHSLKVARLLTRLWRSATSRFPRSRAHLRRCAGGPARSTLLMSGAETANAVKATISDSRKKTHARVVKIRAGRDAQRPTGSFRGQALSIHRDAQRLISVLFS